MGQVFLRQKVKDYAVWRAVFDELAPLRKKYTCVEEHVYRVADSPNDLVILLNFTDDAKAREYMQLPELREAFQRGGVAGPPEVTAVNEA